jgi:hypothetical protein
VAEKANVTHLAGRRVRASALRAWNTEDAPALFLPALDQIRGVLARYQVQDPDDKERRVIPAERLEAVRKEAGEIVTGIFAAPQAGGPYPGGYAVYMQDSFPLAPYPRQLNARLAQVAAGVVEAHYDYLARTLPADLMLWLQNPTTSRVAEQSSPPWWTRVVRNPLVRYEPAHTWVDPRGYRLSDRIWHNSTSTRDQIDRLLLNRVGQNGSVEEISRELEPFLLPNRKLKRTKMPYGRDASFDAMRLARTEITHAHAAATHACAMANPFVQGMDWKLSGRHPKRDICDDLATLNEAGERIREPYSIEGAPLAVQDSHPMCICDNLPALVTTPREVIDELYGLKAAGEPAPVTPAARDHLLRLLVGGYLAYQAAGYFTVPRAA